jgi:heptosyltransferase-2
MSPPSALPPPVPARRILVRGVNWLGDAVMTTPALARLRERFPDARITLLAPEKLKELWPGHPAVDEVMTFAPADTVFSVGRRLRDGRFDLALVLPNSPRSALEAWLARIPRRIGYARPWRSLFLTHPVAPRAAAAIMRKRSVAEIRRRNADPADRPPQPEPEAARHQLHEYLHLAAAALGADPEPLPPRLFVAPGEAEAVRAKFNLGELPNIILGLIPGAEYGPAKRWPADRFIAAAREIQRRTGCLWLILGGGGDRELAGAIASGLGGLDPKCRLLAGQTSLRELCALLSLCGVVLTNDTGPMHVAAALGASIVAPFGSTSAGLTGPGLPGGVRHRLLEAGAPCSPCFRRECPIDFRCMTGIGVERVVEAVLGLPLRRDS